MNGTTEALHHHTWRETALKRVAGGSIMEAVGAIAAIALAIVGLAGVFSTTLAAVATIVIGAAILLEGSARGSTQFSRTDTTSQATESYSGGTSAEFLGGLAGIVLGILALLGVSSMTLLSVAIIAFGATFLLNSFTASQSGFGAESTQFSSGSHMLVGLTAAVLGILAVIGIDSLTLVLVGLLCLGAAALFSGSVVGTRSMSAVANK